MLIIWSYFDNIDDKTSHPFRGEIFYSGHTVTVFKSCKIFLATYLIKLFDIKFLLS